MARFKSWQSYQTFQREIVQKRRFVRTAESEEFLRIVAETCKSRLRPVREGFVFWRAQKGHGWRVEGPAGEEVPDPFPRERMKPRRDRASEGRANSKGIPCLYVATTREAAMSEVRPWVGSLVSVAQFKTIRALTAVDCSVHHNADFPIDYFFRTPSPDEVDAAVWADIDRAFSKPVTSSDETAEYAATQTIADLFRAEGYDGVAYKSAFGEKGYNIALFDLDCASLINCSLYATKNVKFEFDQAGNPYFVKSEGS